MVQAYKEFWKRYVDFDGTTSRPKFWYVVLVNMIIEFVLGIFAYIPVLQIISPIIDSLYGLAILVPSLAISIRRLRDAGKHWANIFWYLLPIVGWIILIVYYCQPSVTTEVSSFEERKE